MRLIAFLLLLAPIGAYAATSSELVGKWVHVKYQDKRVEISENGPGYVLTYFKEKRAEKFVAKLVDGVLVANIGPRSQNIDIEKKTGNLIFGGQEYRRLKKGESFEYVQPAMPKW